MAIADYLTLLFKTGCGVDLTTGEVKLTILLWLVVSHLSTMISTVLTVKDETLVHVIQSETSYYLLGICLALINIFVVIFNRDKIATLVFELIKPFQEYEEISKEATIVKQYKRTTDIIGIISFVFLAIICGTKILHPLISIYFSDIGTDFELPFGSVPWKWSEVRKPSFYALCFLISSTSLISSALSHTCWYFTFIHSSFLVITKLKLLVLELRRLDDRTQDLCDNSEEITPFHCLRRFKAEKDAIIAKCNMICLKSIILEHNKIIRLVKVLDGSFQVIVLFYNNMAILIVALCMNLILLDQNINAVTVGVVTIMWTSFLFLLNLSGQLIINQSEYLHRELYFCPWTNKDRSFKLCLLIMMILGHRPMRLTAGRTYTLNMESFYTAMTAIYSYFNILLSLRK